MAAAAIRPDWQTFSRSVAGAGLVLCPCGERLWLTTMVRSHWEQGCFDTPDPCEAGHDWVTRVEQEGDAYYPVRTVDTWVEEESFPPPDVFCARPGCGVKASDALAVARPDLCNEGGHITVQAMEEGFEALKKRRPRPVPPLVVGRECWDGQSDAERRLKR